MPSWTIRESLHSDYDLDSPSAEDLARFDRETGRTGGAPPSNLIDLIDLDDSFVSPAPARPASAAPSLRPHPHSSPPEPARKGNATATPVGSQASTDAGSARSQRVAEPPKAPDAAEPRLGNITCPICMDTPKCLTVTSCGHHFCRTCLMQAVRVSRNTAAYNNGNPAYRPTGSCPVCRASVDLKRSNTKLRPIQVILMKKATFKPQPASQTRSTSSAGGSKRSLGTSQTGRASKRRR